MSSAPLRLFRHAGFIVVVFVSVICHAWATLALYFSAFPETWGGTAVAIAYVVIVAGLTLTARKTRRRLLPAALFGLVLLWWINIEPGNTGTFPPETSRMPGVEFDGDVVTIHDVRNFHYRSETDFDVRYDDRVYRLDQVRTVDLFVSYWDHHEAVAHTFLSFGFEDGRYVCVSIEVRREDDETYDTLKGIFKQYEIMYIWGDERDIVQLRTNYRKEDVYRYRTTCTPQESRTLMVAMLEETNRLKSKPAFYNTLTRNCTSSIVRHVNEVLPRKVPWWRRRLMNGYGDHRAYDHGWLEKSESFEALKRGARIGERARSSEDDADFSERIRR